MRLELGYKLNRVKIDLRERGLFFTLKELMCFLFRPLIVLPDRNRFFAEIFYGVIPLIKRKFSHAQILKIPLQKLTDEVREFWYKNISGEFELDGVKISRREIFLYGGPNPEFSCPVCQKSEWLSRIKQKNLFVRHDCSSSKKCEELCRKQGDELWVHYHQNFNFAKRCSFSLPAVDV